MQVRDQRPSRRNRSRLHVATSQESLSNPAAQESEQPQRLETATQQRAPREHSDVHRTTPCSPSGGIPSGSRVDDSYAENRSEPTPCEAGAVLEEPERG